MWPYFCAPELLNVKVTKDREIVERGKKRNRKRETKTKTMKEGRER